MTGRDDIKRPAVDSLRVELGPRSYDIIIGERLLADAGRYMSSLKDVVVVTDSTVAGHYLAAVEESLGDARIRRSSIVLEAGERTKDFDHLRELTDGLLDRGVERTTTLIALGGGVIGDITGFAAAITLRGLPFIQIPTTLLAQVDSSVGGKTGINCRHGKNLIGAFHQPALVLADIKTLDTLTPRDLLAGYAEVVKYGLINDADFFSWLENNAAGMLEGDSAARRHAVLTSCAAKAAIVAEDEREADRRALLNLGHTFGHALEAETGYSGALLHGEAVAVGICLAFSLSERMGLCRPADAERVRRHLDAVGLPTGLGDIAAPSWTADGLIAHMARDKKVRDGKLTLILAHGIGRSFITGEATHNDIHALLKDALIKPRPINII
ncbi:MAG: 3-dehydroquinate synthase [Rhodospirillales bacterium RIFCSPLOWO2_12_FULL_58_28]|nr:MAG: 3-dehydroquinate synthase [Rhodospirillales bacterium RIFCSPLOWO2_02_FULL_58_16]OHC77310.1 MAG: 3-dehydroquinate synthase [Rhodospirillales bacterium RIFCSPLOWO2_12_FULL_58_28]